MRYQLSTKSEYHAYFSDIQKYVKLFPFLKRNKISQSNFSRFMKGPAYYDLISLDRLELLADDINDTLQMLYNIQYAHKFMLT